MYPNGLPEVLKDATQILVRCDECGQERNMAWVNARRNFEKYNGHVLRCCNVKGAHSYHKRDPELAARAYEKSKQTNLERYGVELAMNSQENIEAKREQFKDQEYLTKRTKQRKKTCLEKYGVEHPMFSEEVKQKVQETNLDRYGVPVPLQNKEIYEKVRQTNLERYGVDNVGKVPEFQEKASETNMELYGVRRYNELPEMREWLRVNGPKFLEATRIRGAGNGTPKSQESKDKQRAAVTKRILEGTWAGGYKSNCRGRYPSIKCIKEKPRFLSSLELLFHYYLDQNPDVEWYNYEALCVPYIHPTEGTEHNYFPDFLIKYFNDDILHIVEIKTWKEKDSLVVKAKQEAGLNYADANNMTYTLLYDEDVNKFELDIEIVKRIPGIELQNNND